MHEHDFHVSSFRESSNMPRAELDASAFDLHTGDAAVRSLSEQVPHSRSPGMRQFYVVYVAHMYVHMHPDGHG